MPKSPLFNKVILTGSLLSKPTSMVSWGPNILQNWSSLLDYDLTNENIVVSSLLSRNHRNFPDSLQPTSPIQLAISYQNVSIQEAIVTEILINQDKNFLFGETSFRIEGITTKYLDHYKENLSQIESSYFLSFSFQSPVLIESLFSPTQKKFGSILTLEAILSLLLCRLSELQIYIPKIDEFIGKLNPILQKPPRNFSLRGVNTNSGLGCIGWIKFEIPTNSLDLTWIAQYSNILGLGPECQTGFGITYTESQLI